MELKLPRPVLSCDRDLPSAEAIAWPYHRQWMIVNEAGVPVPYHIYLENERIRQTRSDPLPFVCYHRPLPRRTPLLFILLAIAVGAASVYFA